MKKLFKSLTTEEFIIKAKLIHGDKYDYNLVNYIHSRTRVKIICKTHGVFEQAPDGHLRGRNCPQCAKILQNPFLTNEKFLEKANKIHNNKYTYPEAYTNYKQKMRIVCPFHGEFVQCVHTHLCNHGCPTCRKSKGEIKIKNILEVNDIKYEPQKRFDDCRAKIPLPFDFYLPDFNTLIEFDGKHHFVNVSVWGHHKLEETQAHDAIKTAYCKANNIPLVRIRYDEDIEQRVLELLKLLKVA